MAEKNPLAVLLERERELAAYLEDPAHRELEAAARGLLFSAPTIVLLAAIALLGGGMLLHRQLFPLFCRDESAYPIFLVFGGVFLTPVVLAALGAGWRDWRCHRLQECADPRAAYRRFFLALRTGRERQAYAALVPEARRRETVAPVKFTHLDLAGSPPPFVEHRGFRRYWRWVLGPATVPGHSRKARLRRVRLIDSWQERFVRVGGEILFATAPNQAAGAFGLPGALVSAIFQTLGRTIENKPFSKLLLRARGRWWFLEGELQGALDGVALPEEAEGSAARLAGGSP